MIVPEFALVTAITLTSPESKFNVPRFENNSVTELKKSKSAGESKFIVPEAWFVNTPLLKLRLPLPVKLTTAILLMDDGPIIDFPAGPVKFTVPLFATTPPPEINPDCQLNVAPAEIANVSDIVSDPDILIVDPGFNCSDWLFACDEISTVKPGGITTFDTEPGTTLLLQLAATCHEVPCPPTQVCAQAGTIADTIAMMENSFFFI